MQHRILALAASLVALAPLSILVSSDADEVADAEVANPLWDRTMAVGTAAVDSDGSIYFAGTPGGLQRIDHETGEPSPLNPGLDLDLLSSQAPGRLVAVDWNADTVVGLDITGEVVWTLALDGRLQALATDGMGNAIVLENDHTLSSIDPSGAIRWESTANFAVNPLMAADQAGIYIASGDFHEHWLFGLDADDGSVVWETNEADYDAEFSAIAAANGRIALVGSERVDEDENDVDFIVRAYDSSNGELAWTDRIDGPSDLAVTEGDWGQSVTFDVAGGLVVAGALGMDDAMSTALWLGRYSADGRLLSSETLDDGFAHDCNDLTALPDGDVLISETWMADPGSRGNGRMLLFTP
jgi:outer membrane protein assembly factor BamB